MSYVSKNPRFTTTSVTDSTTGTISSPPSGVDKIINRNGVLYLKNSAGGETPIGSSSGGKNYLAKQSDASAAVGTVSVVAAGGDISVSGTFPNVSSAWYADAGAAAIAISSDNTLRGTSNYLTALTSFSAAGAVYVQTPAFNIDGEDLGKALAVQFDVAGNTTADDWDVVAVRYTSAGVFGALIPIAGIASSTTGTASAQVPTGTTTFRGFFITGSTASDVYSIRWRRRAGAVAIRFDNLIVGPNSVMTGTAITDWQSYTPSFTGITATGVSFFYRRSGDSLDIAGSFTVATTSAVTFSVSIPSGLVINSSKVTSANETLKGGIIGSTGLTYPFIGVDPSVSTSLLYNITNASPITKTLGTSFAAGETTMHALAIPITGWSSNVTMADRAVEEFAWSTNTTTTAGATQTDDGLYGNGPTGSQFNSFASTTVNSRTRLRCRFQTPIQQTDLLSLEIYDNGLNNWSSVGDCALDVCPTTFQNTSIYGMTIETISASATDVYVSFGNCGRIANASTYANNNASGWSGVAGSASYKWRVRKVSGGAAVGFPVGARNVIGDTTGTAVPAGMIGEFVKGSGTIGPSTGTGGQFQNITTISLTAGDWDIKGLSRVRSSTTAPNDFQLAISIYSANTTTDHTSSDNVAFQTISGTSVDCAVAIPSTRLLLSATTTVYFKASFGTINAGTQVLSSVISARRVC